KRHDPHPHRDGRARLRVARIEWIVAAEGIHRQPHHPAARTVRPQTRNDDTRAILDVEGDLLISLAAAVIACPDDEAVRTVLQLPGIERQIEWQRALEERLGILVQVDADARRIHSASSSALIAENHAFGMLGIALTGTEQHAEHRRKAG